MTTILEIEFFNPYDSSLKPIHLQWEVLDGDAATIWLRCLYQSISKEQLLYARFNGFENSPKGLDFLSKKMNDAIDIINFEGVYPHIKERADGKFNQQFANIMHHHFELLFGDAKNPSDYFKDSSYIGQAAISALNHCVHDMEAVTRSSVDDDSSRAIVFEVLHRQQFLLPQHMEKEFTFDLEFGDICLHYGLVGKTWWEVFLDEDEDIFPEGIRPLDVIGPEFDIHFHKQNPDEETKKKFFEYLKKNGKDPLDPSLRLGFLPVARLIKNTHHDKSHITQQIGERSGVSKIALYKNTKLWIERELKNESCCQEGFLKLNPIQVLERGDSVFAHGFPNEAFIVSGAQDGTILSKSITKGSIVESGHAIAFYVPNDGNSVILPISDANRGLHWKEDYIIKPGELLCALYDGHGSYIPAIPNSNFNKEGK